MHIIWHGQTCFQIIASRRRGEQVKIIIDPLRKIEADIVLLTQENYPPTNAFLIAGPGEYEVKGIFIQGIPTSSNNTIYTIDAEEMRLCHLGNLAQKELTPGELDKMGNIDILLVPASAPKIVSQVEPRIAIPMGEEKIDKFFKAIGQKCVESQDKLLIKKKDLPEGETKFVVLKP